MKTRIGHVLIIATLSLGWPRAAMAQDAPCDRKLSVLQADVDRMRSDLDGSVRDIERLMASVARIERSSLRADICPADTTERTASERDAVTAIDAAAIARQAEADLICTQGFVARVSSDIEKAERDGDTAMVVRLNAISKRILDMDTLATSNAQRAEHLASRRGRLLNALDRVDTNCTSMDSIYE